MPEGLRDDQLDRLHPATRPGWVHCRDEAMFEVRRAVRCIGVTHSSFILRGLQRPSDEERLLQLVDAAGRVVGAAESLLEELVAEARATGVPPGALATVLGKTSSSMSNFFKKHTLSEDRLQQLLCEREAWLQLELMWTGVHEVAEDADYGTPAEISFDYGIGRLLHAWQECRAGWRKMITDNKAGYEQVRSGFAALGQSVEALADPGAPDVILRHTTPTGPLDFDSFEDSWDESPEIYFRQCVFLAILGMFSAAAAIKSWTEDADSSAFVRIGTICQEQLDAAVRAIDKNGCFRVLDSVHAFLRETGYMPESVDAEAMLRRINRKYGFDELP